MTKKTPAAFNRAIKKHADEMFSILEQINAFWVDCAIYKKSGAALSPSAMITGDDRTISQAVAEVIARIEN